MKEPEIHFDMMFGEYEQHKAILQRLDRESGEYIGARIAALQESYRANYGGVTNSIRRTAIDDELFAMSDNFSSAWTFLLTYLVHVRGPMTLQEFSDDDEIMQYLNAVMPTPQMVRLYGTLMWQTCQWIHSGRKIFALTPAVIERLRWVRLQGVTLGDLAPPFRSFYVLLPRGLEHLGIWAKETFFPLRGVYVTYEYPSCHVCVIGQWLRREVEQSAPGAWTWDNHVSWWALTGNESRPLYEAAFDQTTGPSLNLYRYANGSMHSHRDGGLRELATWVANLLAYLSDSELRREMKFLDPQVERLEEKLRRHPKGRKRERVKAELRGRSRQRVIVVGSDVSSRAPGVNGNGRTLEIRQKVRGHKRRVCVGRKGLERKEVTIAPYWRGPEDGEESQSRYMLR